MSGTFISLADIPLDVPTVFKELSGREYVNRNKKWVDNATH